MDYNNNPIIVYTAYSYKQMKEYQLYFYRSLRICFYLISPIIIAVTIMSIFYVIFETRSSAEPIQLPVIAFAIPISMLFFLGYMSFALYYTKKRHKTMTVHLQSGQTCAFRNNDYTMEMNHPDASGSMTFQYNTILRAVETKNMFYLHTDKQIATLLDKQGFKNGSPEELRQILLNNLPAAKCKFMV